MADSYAKMAHWTAPSVWKILVVDDEPAIHQVTKLALRNLSVMGRASQLINALSAKEARAQLQEHPDIAVILMDVVMETENAGLDFIKYVREQAANHWIRIILRTGQPGQAPERQIMLDYDINDYKEKTELTANKLYTAVVSSIRTFGHLQTMEIYRRTVEVLGHLNTAVFAAPDIPALAQALVAQLGTLGLFTGIDCRSPAEPGTVIAMAGLARSAQEPCALIQQALKRPGSPAKVGGLYAIAVVPASAAPLVLCMTAACALTPSAAHALDLWAHSARLAVAHWSASVGP